MNANKLDATRVAVIGLGYVGLPLAVEFGKQYTTIGFDVYADRVKELQDGHDRTLECSAEELADSPNMTYSCDATALNECNTYIVTVPTPIDDANQPDLSPLKKASETIGKALSKGDVVIYESTVYPGATEEVCVPVLEKFSGLKYNEDFFCGYSPERINPGDKEHRVTNILKVTSGSTPDIADFVDALYRSIIPAGTHKASSIRVAEAAKVIENTQRDVNIALVNELALIFDRLGIDTLDVLEAAGTKWNFLPFKPGLVGGHCISVDPYYLTHKAQQIGYHPDVILAGRRINDGMGQHVAERVIRQMAGKRIEVVNSRVLMLGLAFKENCPDLRNTRVVDIIAELERYSVNVDVYDPWIDPKAAHHEYGITPVEAPNNGDYDAIIIAVGHHQFIELGAEKIRDFGKDSHVLFDVKGLFPRDLVDARL